MKLRVNGDERDMDAQTVAELLDALSIDREAKGVAVAVNESVVPRGQWADAAIKEGDAVEIIRVVQGG